MLFISESAKTKIEELIQLESNPEQTFVRVTVSGGGCSGLSYKMDFDNEEQENDQVFESNFLSILRD